MLNRAMGQPAGQELDLVDTVPFAEYAEPARLRTPLQLAYTRRKDLLGTTRHSSRSRLETAEGRQV